MFSRSSEPEAPLPSRPRALQQLGLHADAAPFPACAYQVLFVNKRLGIVGPPPPGRPAAATRSTRPTTRSGPTASCRRCRHEVRLCVPLCSRGSSRAVRCGVSVAAAGRAGHADHSQRAGLHASTPRSRPRRRSRSAAIASCWSAPIEAALALRGPQHACHRRARCRRCCPACRTRTDTSPTSAPACRCCGCAARPATSRSSRWCARAPRRRAPGEWIQGRSWDQNDWPVKDWPTHDKLTAAAPNNPVYLTRVDGHAALVNKAALDAAGITRDDRRIRRAGASSATPSGEPTGVLIDSAQELVASQDPAGLRRSSSRSRSCSPTRETRRSA